MEMWVYESTRKKMSEHGSKDWWVLIAMEDHICDFMQMTKERKKKLT